MTLPELIKTRRSTRVFEARPIEPSAVTAIAESALYAPSAMNRQTWHFTVLTRREDIDALAASVRIALDLDDGYCFYRPAAFIITSNARENPMGADDCACALQNIFLTAHAYGVGSVWINQLRHVCDEPKVRTLLTSYGVPVDHVVYGCAALGYPAAEPREKQIADKCITIYSKDKKGE